MAEHSQDLGRDEREDKVSIEKRADQGSKGEEALPKKFEMACMPPFALMVKRLTCA